MIRTPPIDAPFKGPVPRPSRDRGERQSVLIVEDEPSICRAVAISLTRAGYNPVTTTSGEGALYYLRTQYFDAMLVDLRIPDMRGDVVYHLAISLQPQLRRQTLFTTGDVTEQAAELIEACGCPVLMKPFDLKDLGEAIGELLRDSQEDLWQHEGTTGR
jgi:DNA-binding response OmpR family regulator